MRGISVLYMSGLRVGCVEFKRIFCERLSNNFLTNFRWFHGKISREQAEQLLEPEHKKGSFLVRESQNFQGDYTLSVWYGLSNSY